jgi:hypothetical protein
VRVCVCVGVCGGEEGLHAEGLHACDCDCVPWRLALCGMLIHHVADVVHRDVLSFVRCFESGDAVLSSSDGDDMALSLTWASGCSGQYQVTSGELLGSKEEGAGFYFHLHFHLPLPLPLTPLLTLTLAPSRSHSPFLPMIWLARYSLLLVPRGALRLRSCSSGVTPCPGPLAQLIAWIFFAHASPQP